MRAKSPSASHTAKSVADWGEGSPFKAPPAVDAPRGAGARCASRTNSSWESLPQRALAIAAGSTHRRGPWLRPDTGGQRWIHERSRPIVRSPGMAWTAYRLDRSFGVGVRPGAGPDRAVRAATQKVVAQGRPARSRACLADFINVSSPRSGELNRPGWDAPVEGMTPCASSSGPMPDRHLKTRLCER